MAGSVQRAFRRNASDGSNRRFSDSSASIVASTSAIHSLLGRTVHEAQCYSSKTMSRRDTRSIGFGRSDDVSEGGAMSDADKQPLRRHSVEIIEPDPGWESEFGRVAG